MSHDTLKIIWFIILALVWAIYFSQELFILGTGALHRLVTKNDAEIKQIQYSTALHWDGIEVWLILAIAGMFAAFPKAFAVTLSSLYIPFFLLLYSIIARGISIELIFKTDNKKVQRILSKTWMISSMLMVFILGLYITNIFRGLPIGLNGMEKSFLSIFNLTGILGGILFLCLSLAIGSAWIKMTTEGQLGNKAFKYGKYSAYILPWILPLIFQGMNTTDNPISNGTLFLNNNYLYIIPALTAVFALLTAYYVSKASEIKTFVFSILTIVFFVATGFVGTYPYMVVSNIKSDYGVTLFEAGASEKALTVLTITAVIAIPIIIAYQAFKYIKFSQKVKLGDDK